MTPLIDRFRARLTAELPDFPIETILAVLRPECEGIEREAAEREAENKEYKQAVCLELDLALAELEAIDKVLPPTGRNGIEKVDRITELVVQRSHDDERVNAYRKELEQADADRAALTACLRNLIQLWSQPIARTSTQAAAFHGSLREALDAAEALLLAQRQET